MTKSIGPVGSPLHEGSEPVVPLSDPDSSVAPVLEVDSSLDAVVAWPPVLSSVTAPVLLSVLLAPVSASSAAVSLAGGAGVGSPHPAQSEHTAASIHRGVAIVGHVGLD